MIHRNNDSDNPILNFDVFYMEKGNTMSTKWKHFIFFILIILFITAVFIPKTYQGATSYTNAKEFYNSTDTSKPYHMEASNGTIYYATSAKQASSNSNLRYHTIGFDISLSGNGYSLSFGVKRNGNSMVEIDSTSDQNYVYNLYAINDSTLYDLAEKADPVHASYILNAPVITVKMNAILTTKSEGILAGDIKEDGKGGLIPEGDVYHLNNPSDLAKLKDIFEGHTFQSYINMECTLDNPLLQIQYNINGTDTANTTCSSIATVGNGYSSKDGVLYQNNIPYLSVSRVLQTFTLLDPAVTALSKPGYHLNRGQEWTYDNYYFTSTSYMPKSITPSVGHEDQNITMYANWQPNTYTLHYDANGGTGSISSMIFSYDFQRKLQLNTFTRTGYQPKPGAEWNTSPDGTGASYKAKETVKNLTTEHNAQVTLYANWEPIVAAITLDEQGGSGGCDTFYAKYETGFFTDDTCSSALTIVTLPVKTGHTFQGYFEGPLGMGRQIIDSNGQFQIDTAYFVKDTTIYAHYTTNQYKITFDKQGGSYGSDSVIVAYQEYLPNAAPPIRSGYTFKGYYTKPNGAGSQYYDEHMSSLQVYTSAKNLTLYAYWKDETNPSIQLKKDADGWSNQTITLTANATDTGVGLKNIQIYELSKDGNLTLVKENKNCNGVAEYSLSYPNPTEGIIRYKAVATDSAGNTAEAYQTVYYDITAPKGETIAVKKTEKSLSFQFHITDVNIK